MNKKINWLIIFLILIITGCGSDYFFNKADKAYNELRYSVAIENYKKGLETERKIEAVENLANSYRLTNQLQKAQPLYLEASKSFEANPKVYFYLGKIYLSNQKYTEAVGAFSTYLEKKPDDIVAQMLKASCLSINEKYRDTTLFELTDIPTVDFQNAFSATEYGDGIIFAADKEVFSGSKKAGWTGNSYLDLYYMEKAANGLWLSPVLLEGKLSGKFHEGSATFNEEGNVVFFTRSNYYRRRLKKNDRNENNLKIFKSTYEDNKWKKLEELPFNNDDYSCGHPTLDKDGKTLYFISDMPGGEGGTDIYKTIFEEGKWSEPENLGKEINTPGNEMFPYIHSDGTLYFSSDAHNTMGGLDVYMTYFDSDKWVHPENLNYPLNTPGDDFGFILLGDDKTGFVSSSRTNKDRLYEFKKNPPKFNLYGTARTKGTQEKVKGVTVTITQESNGKEYKMVSDNKGEFNLKLSPEEKYLLVCTKIGCFTRTDVISTKNLKYSQNFYADFEVEKIELYKPIVLENIYFDFDKWHLRKESIIELKKLVKLLQDNPTIHIEMGSHTDARGTDEYNLVLSDKRALMSVRYLIYKGVDSSRLTWKGYGESKPVNKCIDGVKCKKAEHQNNRRTEFKVTKK